MSKRKRDADEKETKPSQDTIETRAREFAKRIHDLVQRVKKPDFSPKLDLLIKYGVEVEKSPKYWKIRAATREKTDLYPYFACVGRETGDVYASSDGSVPAKALKKGNVTSDDGGLGHIDQESVSFKKGPWKPAGAPSKPKKPRASAPACVEDPSPFLGSIFDRSHGSYSPPSIWRIVGWTKSKKRVCIERVPVLSSKASPLADGGHCCIDRKWLDAHPVTKNQYAPGIDLAILRPGDGAAEEGFPEGAEPHLVIDGESAFRVTDLDQSWSWCDY